jgi:hypothetical protein
MAQQRPRRGHRHQSKAKHSNRIRVRGKRLDQVDETKLALAYWLLAKKLAEDKCDPRELTEEEVRKVAEQLEDDDRQPRPRGGGAS